jgi:dipeptidyl aminopeptidase/acylaminoacyl peptidase
LQQLRDAPAAKYLIIHGDSDAIVHHDQSERFASSLRSKGADVETMSVPGAGHHWFTWAEDNPARRRAHEEPNATIAPELLAFLARHLR